MDILSILFKKQSTQNSNIGDPSKTEVDLNKLYTTAEKNKEITVLVDNSMNGVKLADDIASSILNDWDFEDNKYQYDALDHRELLIKLEQKDLENFELKNELSYYERYVQFIEDNYILILKSNKNIKEIFNNLTGENHE